MWQKQSKSVFKKRNKKFVYALIGVCIGGLLLVGCGASANTGTTTASAGMPAQNQAAQGQAQAASNTGNSSVDQKSAQSGNSAHYGPQYLVKSLQVTMEVQDTRQSASELQQWLGTADPQATSDGSDYESTGANQYNVTLTFLIDTTHYTQVENYLRDYAGQNGRTLLSLHESVQDVTNDYVDTQATLTNLRAEQQRLLSFMNQAQNLNDTLNIEQQLTQVDGQINTIEAHLNALQGQTTFYTITINLQPVGSAPPPPAMSSPWSVIPIWQGAWAAVIAVWQVLATLLVWLAAFSVYIIPVGIVVWLVRRRRWSRLPSIARVMPVSKPGNAEPK